MKEGIILTIDNNSIIIDFRIINKDEKIFVNKNNIYKNSFYYTFKYYKKHINKIISNIKDKYPNQLLNTLRLDKILTFKYCVPIINYFKIENLVLNFLSTIDLEDYDLFLKLDSIKNIYCYYMPSGVVNKFKSKNVNVYMASIKEVSDDFLNQQDAIEHDTLYYKNVIKIKKEYSLLLDDLREFLKINYNLKAIHVYVYSKEIIQGIVDLVKNDESRNVVVFLHQGYDSENFIVENFEWLRELSESCKKDYTCEFRIIYSNSFLGKNLFKQLTFNNLKLISVLCIYVCLVSLIIIKAYDYIEEVSVQQLKTQMIGNNLIEDDEELDDADIELEEEIGLTPEEKEKKKQEIKSRYKFQNSMKALKKINSEVQGYLNVNNTEISYPIVQHSDNNYYLKHDIYKNRTSMGWVFMDYRDKIEPMSDNIIIYGHSMKNGTMFGTLKKTLNTSWRKNEDNLIISFDTEKHKYRFKIFSVYRVDYTTDYLRVSFDSTEEKESFIKLIRGRSSLKSKQEVTAEDKILTLSTCTGSNNRRLVVHAVLLKEGEE